MPAIFSRGGRSSSSRRSLSTANGGAKVPAKFLLSYRLTPFLTPTPESSCASTVVGTRISAHAAMGGRGDEADGVEHGTAADRDDEGVAVDVVLEQDALHLLDVEQLVLDLLAAGHRQRRADQLHAPVVMRGVGGDLGGQPRPPGKQAVIDEDQAAMPALRLPTPQHVGQDRVVRHEQPFGEMHRVLEGDGKPLQAGRLHRLVNLT